MNAPAAERVIAMIPTWNESANIEPLVREVLAASPEMEALVVDDDSPDGTWRIVARMIEEERAARPDAPSRVHLLHRRTARGRGLAGIAGFREALRLGADRVLEMDADFSHHPRFIPALLAARDRADVVIGSRLVAGGGEVGRSPARRVVTALASRFIRAMLSLPVNDPTSGYRLFSRRCLEALPWEAMRAEGPAVLQEMLLAARARGFTFAEVPILFEERRAGVSSFNPKIARRSLAAIFRLRFAPGGLVPDRPNAEEEERP